MATTDSAGAAVVVFITGQQDCSQDDFDLYYAPAIESALKEGYSFAIGNAAGVDAFAKKLLWDVHHCARVTIYDKGAKTGDIPERDFQMMLDSNKIVCYLFGNSGGTGTHRNLLLFFALKTAPPQARPEDLRLHPDQVLQLNRKCHRGGLWDLKGWQLD
jgi:hypothetical protein